MTNFCFKCGEKSTWEALGFYYCDKHKPLNEDDFDPEEAEMDVINLFKRGLKFDD